MNMQITEITIHPTNGLGRVRAHVDIVFDNCFMVGEIRIMQGSTGLFVSFPAKRQKDGTHWDIAFPANAETRMMIQQAILAEYEKIAGKSEPTSNAPPSSERLKGLEQLRNDGVISEQEYNAKRKEILGEL
jgi:stage V sporulation protein G